DPATRRLFGVPVVTTVSEAAGVARALARDTVVIDTDNHGVGVQWLDDKGFVLTGASGGSDQAQWRHALGHPLATSCPGIFAVGDVRSGSVKRVASGVGECSIVVASVHQALINS